MSGCSAIEQAAPVSQAISYRNQTQPIASKALFEPMRFAGDWRVVAGYPGPDLCQGGRLSIEVTGAQFTETLRCPDRSEPRVLSGKSVGPGRYQAGAQTRWVLWTDEGYRTAVIGTPDGSMAWILDRTARIPADRRAAARELLDFNGYDLSRLQEVSQ